MRGCRLSREVISYSFCVWTGAGSVSVPHCVRWPVSRFCPEAVESLETDFKVWDATCCLGQHNVAVWCRPGNPYTGSPSLFCPNCALIPVLCASCASTDSRLCWETYLLVTVLTWWKWYRIKYGPISVSHLSCTGLWVGLIGRLHFWESWDHRLHSVPSTRCRSQRW